MVATSGRLLVPQAWRAIRFAVERTSRAIRERLPQSSKTLQAELQPVVSTAVNQLTTRAPFASTLRPNLTGGTLSRTAGGYGTGAGRMGGARYFSHSPAAPAEVVNNVSAAMRAFWLSGQRIQYDGSDHRTGAMRYKAVSHTREKAGKGLQKAHFQAPGSYVDFKLSPVITAISPLGNLSVDGENQNTLNRDGLLETLSVDFVRALKDLSLVTNDLKKLSTFGDLALEQPESNILRVRFPGCDAITLESLCAELEIERGIVHEDPDFDAYNGTEMALLFPFAPTRLASENIVPTIPRQESGKREELTWQGMLSPELSPSQGFSHISATSHDFEDVQVDANPWLTSPSGYSSLHGSSELDAAHFFEKPAKKSNPELSDYEGLEGIYRFLEECDRARR
ncbi:putative casein kinase ii beta 2 subunit [Phaeomoniella chlamydospora]|uniref:Putative casein kinase ii beta 2 subunit n=1 Tax=Phaeomoniella chlamydospora TaxID=158046 RepID=A0A0G2H916_PHACM|nr:putative casein kinase ii beta 2 subunit [Phaeomoniella chlamydospora]